MRATPESAATGRSGLQGTPVAPVGAARPLWKVFLFFLAPMLLSNIL